MQQSQTSCVCSSFCIPMAKIMVAPEPCVHKKYVPVKVHFLRSFNNRGRLKSIEGKVSGVRILSRLPSGYPISVLKRHTGLSSLYESAPAVQIIITKILMRY